MCDLIFSASVKIGSAKEMPRKKYFKSKDGLDVLENS